MSSRLTSLCDSPPSAIYGPGVFDNLRELSEESTAPTKIYDITRDSNGFKSFRVIEPPCTNCQRKGIPYIESDTASPIQYPQPPQLPIRSPTRPSTLASTSTSIQPPVARASSDPISPEPESIFETCCRWNITGNFTDQKKVNKKVVTSVFSEADALTEVFVDKAMKSAIPGEPTIALAKEEVAYEDAMVVQFREALKEF
ncbi:hypothetical protein O181_127740 [Austropuccinia psidii MF-1]|uniref:Uncharacterized protein n=1 Tax=Austropuccinia psidii MF-1 TaxID=1389203 RepID=A0A9Q3KZ05_9BASI|nr:hypothetical protein [Austropuccinia psidii MF-1]